MSGSPILRPLSLDAPARHAVLIVNPFAGGVRRPAVEHIAHRLGVEDAAILEVGRDGSAQELAARAVNDRVQLLLVAGGDGTLHQAIQALAGTGTALGVLPLGTSNDLARRLGMSTALGPALAEIETAETSAIDLLRMGHDWVATVGGLGFPAHVARTCNRLKARPWIGRPAQALGKAIYTLAAAHRILQYGPEPATCRIGLGTEPAAPSRVSALLVGTVDRFGGGLELVPASQLRSGTFAALLVTATTRPAILDTLLRVRAGRPLRRHARRLAHLTHLTFRADRLVGAFGDGEWLGLRHRLAIRIAPAALRVLIPVRPGTLFIAASASLHQRCTLWETLGSARNAMVSTSHAPETVLKQGGASHFKGMEAVGGKLFLTDRRLVFKSHRFNIQVHEESYPLAEITAVEPRRGISIVGDGLAVVLNGDREERFVVFGRRDWMTQILSARDLAAPIPATPP